MPQVNTYELDPSSIPGEVFEWPPLPLAQLNTDELTAGRSGLGAIPFRSGALAQVRLAKGGAIPWGITWGSAGKLSAATNLPAGVGTFADQALALPSHGAAYLEVNWGTRASRHTALIDWAGGGQLQVVGTYVQTSVVLPNVVSEGGVIRDSVDLRCIYQPMAYFSSIVPGGIGLRPRVTKTMWLGAVPVANEVLCSIPPFAKRVIVSMAATSATVSLPRVNFWTAGNPLGAIGPQLCAMWIPASVAYQGQHVQRMFWYPVPAEASYASVLMAGVNQQHVTLVFELDL